MIEDENLQKIGSLLVKLTNGEYRRFRHDRILAQADLEMVIETNVGVLVNQG